MQVSFVIDKYRVVFLNTVRPSASIKLYDDANVERVSIQFDETQGSPGNPRTTVTLDNSDRVWVTLPISLLDSVIDVLRNEKPMEVYADTQTNVFLLITGKEPVGEEETRSIFKFVGIPYDPV